MNKKISSSVLVALMIAGSTSFSTFAAMPTGTVVIGTKAFDLTYANSASNISEITTAIANGGSVYVKNFNGDWIDNLTELKVAASFIPAVTYKDAAGKISNFDVSDTNAVNTDNVKPIALSIKQTDSTTIEVSYNEEVRSSTGLSLDNYTLRSGTNLRLDIKSAEFKANTGNKTVVLKLASAQNLTGDDFFLISGVEDIVGNVIDTIFTDKAFQ